MKNLKYFFDKWLSWLGDFGSFEELQKIDITFTLDRDMMINETQVIENVVKMADQLSQETLDEMNPWVENHKKEQERRDKEAKEQQEKEELYQFEADLDDNNQNAEIDEENKEETDNNSNDNQK